MVGNPLQLEGNSPQRLGARRRFPAAQRLQGLAVRRGVPDGGVPRKRLSVVDGTLIRTASKRPLYASVLVAQGYLQMEHGLPMALEAEMPRLDHPGMNGTHGHLVYLLSVNAEELCISK